MAQGHLLDTSAALMCRDHDTRPMVTIHQQPISFSIPQADSAFGSLIHCETVAQGRRIHNGEPTYMFMPRMGILCLSDYFCYAQTNAYGARPSP